MRFAVARQEGLDERQVAAIDEGFEASSLDERQKTAIRFTDLCLRAEAPDAGLRAQLLEHFSPEQIVELAAGVALFMGFSKIAIALGQAPDSMPVTELPTPDWPAG